MLSSQAWRVRLQTLAELLPGDPNLYTALGLLSAGIGWFWRPAFFLAFLSDALDGAVARAKGKATLGGFFDGVADRLVEGAALLLLLFQGFLLAAPLLFFGTCLTSFVKVYAKAKGGRVGFPTLFPREMRGPLILASLFVPPDPLLLFGSLASALTFICLFASVIPNPSRPFRIDPGD